MHFVPQSARDGVATQIHMQPRFLFCHRTLSAKTTSQRGGVRIPARIPNLHPRAAPIPRRIPRLGLEFPRPARRHMQDEVGILGSTRSHSLLEYRRDPVMQGIEATWWWWALSS